MTDTLSNWRQTIIKFTHRMYKSKVSFTQTAQLWTHRCWMLSGRIVFAMAYYSTQSSQIKIQNQIFLSRHNFYISISTLSPNSTRFLRISETKKNSSRLLYVREIRSVWSFWTEKFGAQKMWVYRDKSWT